MSTTNTRVLNDDLNLALRQGYSRVLDVALETEGQPNAVVKINVYVDAFYLDQSRIHAQLFDGSQFHEIVSIAGSAPRAKRHIVSNSSDEDRKVRSLEALSDTLLDSVTNIWRAQLGL